MRKLRLQEVTQLSVWQCEDLGWGRWDHTLVPPPQILMVGKETGAVSSAVPPSVKENCQMSWAAITKYHGLGA